MFRILSKIKSLFKRFKRPDDMELSFKTNNYDDITSNLRSTQSYHKFKEDIDSIVEVMPNSIPIEDKREAATVAYFEGQANKTKEFLESIRKDDSRKLAKSIEKLEKCKINDITLGVHELEKASKHYNLALSYLRKYKSLLEIKENKDVKKKRKGNSCSKGKRNRKTGKQK